jgi:hypothetical protein
VIAVVGLVALLAIAAENAHEVDEAQSFDGWVAVTPTHPLRLYYEGDRERTIALCDLRVEDTVGVRYAVLDGSDGEIQPVRRAVPAPRPALAAPPPRAPPRPPAPPALAPPVAPPPVQPQQSPSVAADQLRS